MNRREAINRSVAELGVGSVVTLLGEPVHGVEIDWPEEPPRIKGDELIQIAVLAAWWIDENDSLRRRYKKIKVPVQKVERIVRFQAQLQVRLERCFFYKIWQDEYEAYT